MENVREARLRDIVKQGIGYLHEGMHPGDQDIMHTLFQSGAIQVCPPPLMVTLLPASATFVVMHHPAPLPGPSACPSARPCHLCCRAPSCTTTPSHPCWGRYLLAAGGVCLFSLGTDPVCAQVIVATAPMCWGMTLAAHLVVIMGTQYYDGAHSQGADDYPVTDLLQMMGRASRPDIDDSGKSVPCPSSSPPHHAQSLCVGCLISQL